MPSCGAWCAATMQPHRDELPDHCEFSAIRCNRRLCRPRQVSIALAGFTFLYGCHLYFTAQINPQAIATARHPAHICLATGLTPPTSAPRLGSPPCSLY